ncbi:cytosolic beta-glucosidase [Elysia marginata]|uniref:Cytosolic beta-glucosidase n=1 Tax=Elysia marginata TaxID=1093978 RepID=A0AAV4JGM4_9GAST|nr:cytosolic beta-glucosidase [Elysia marginata]
MQRKRRGGSVGRLNPRQKRMRRQREVNEEAGNKHEPEAQLNDFTNIPAHILTEVQIEAQEVVSHYSFYFSWSQLLPKGNEAEFEEKQVNHYNSLINELRANNIE